MKIELTIILTALVTTIINKVGGKLISDNLPDLNYKSLIKYGKTALMHISSVVIALTIGIFFISCSKEEKALLVLIVVGVIAIKVINDQMKKEGTKNKMLLTTNKSSLLFPNS